MSNVLEHATVTEYRMLQVMQDGLPHARRELHACLNDELSALSAIKKHIQNLRERVRPFGLYIVCEIANSTISYRLVKLITPQDALQINRKARRRSVDE